MSDKDIKKFLPPIYRTEKVDNFLDSTTNVLFQEDKAERVNYFVGKKVGGLYKHLSEPYVQATSKMREDYQLEPSLVERDPLTGEVSSVLYYEDLLNSLKTAGAYTQDQNRLFRGEVFSFSPPIDYDLFINYRDYYWVPEGAPSIEVDEDYADIVGSMNYVAKVKGLSESLDLTTGNHIILNDGKEYIVDGVGVNIRLLEFDRSTNVPLRVERAFFSAGLSEYEKFPKEYITIERGAIDQNVWSRNNAWYHIDALYPNVSTISKSRVDRDRRANRPIIQFIRDIELYNYERDLDSVDVWYDGTTLPTDTIDDVNVVRGLTAIKSNSKKIYRYDGSTWEELRTPDGKVVILDGRTKKSIEVSWDGSWTLLQQKRYDTQHPLFQLYDDNGDNATPNKTGDGNIIFGYKENENGIFDNELEMYIEHRMLGDSSDFVFTNGLRDYAESIDNPRVTYKRINESIDLDDRLFTFTMGYDEYTQPTIYVNDKQLPTLVLNSGMSYVFDYGDSSTTAKGWFGRYYPISIVDDAGNQVLRATHGDSAKTNLVFNESLNAGESARNYYYRVETDHSIMGEIKLVPSIILPNETFHNEFRYKGMQLNRLRQYNEITEDGSSEIELKYQPINDNIVVKVNGVIVQDYEFNSRKVKYNELESGDFFEVEYSTRQSITDDSDIIQDPYYSLSNNGKNGDVFDASYSDVFEHFNSIINNQRQLSGDNKRIYRDSSKNISLGDHILKHETPMVPLMFTEKNDNTNLIHAIEHSAVQYTQYKNNLILKSEEYARDNVITNDNVRNVFDEIITEMNTPKQNGDSFSSTLMFASYRNFNNLDIDASGSIIQPLELSNSFNILYLYTDEGLQIVGEDYDIDLDDSTGRYVITPNTFYLNEITLLRYYDNAEPTFCPATPAKFGIYLPIRPAFEIDTTYKEPVLFIVGHDNSRLVAYTSVSDYNNGDYDGRDLIMLEFEKRIYNGIPSKFKDIENKVIDTMMFRAGKFRNTEYTRDEILKLEHERFFNWATTNIADYTTNNSFIEGDLFTYNYGHNVDQDGEELSGHWKGIYLYYYDTTQPHKKPWEMLGFDLKPSWFDDEYGNNYGSGNTNLWNDLEEGIIRQGSRANVDRYAYMNDNPYRRIGLSSYIPVDDSGNLLNPVDAGITTEPSPNDSRKSWKFGDNAPVEQAWRMMSEYAYHQIIALYLRKPTLVTTKLWDTEVTLDNATLHNINVNEYRVKSYKGNDQVYGITQWIHDLLMFDGFSPEYELNIPFDNIEVNLGHKIGGFVNSYDLKTYAESYNPASSKLSTLIPNEDVSILTSQSKDIKNVIYSGIIVERVQVSKSFFLYINGYNYGLNDLIYVPDDNAYYKKITDSVKNDWATSNDYSIGDAVIYNGYVYIATQSHTSTISNEPDLNTAPWRLKPYNDNDWAILINPPKIDKTEFRVVGYDINTPYFPVSVPLIGGNKRSVRITTSDSKPIAAQPWGRQTYYIKGHIVSYADDYFESKTTHTSGDSFDPELWIKWSTPPMTGGVRVPYTDEGNGDVELIEYGTRYRSIEDLVEFIASYGRELENRGWVFDEYDNELNAIKNWHQSIKQVVRWAYENKEKGSAITVSPFGNNIKFKPDHGVVSLINKSRESVFDILDHRSQNIPFANIDVTRLNNIFKMAAPAPIYYLKLAIREYEHVLVFNNTTMFDDVHYDPVLGTRKERIRMSGTKSGDWNGTLNAGGYVITNDGMIPNLDTVANELLNVNDMDTIATKDVINELKYHNVGYQTRQYLENLEMSEKSQINFYQGFIRQKGTTEAFQRLLRNNIIDSHDTLDIAEEWAFREGTFGSMYNTLQTEIVIPSSDMNFNPQYINLVYNGYPPVDEYNVSNIEYDNVDRWIMKPERLRDNGDLWKKVNCSYKYKTAGYVNYDEHELKSINFKTLNQVMIDEDVSIDVGMTAWIGYNEYQTGDWDVLLLDDSEVFVEEITNYGNEPVNTVVRAYNIDVDSLYVVTVDDVKYNVSFVLQSDGTYEITPLDDSFFSVPVTTLPEQFNVYIWKTTRIMPDERHSRIDSVDEHLEKHDIEAVEGMLLYKDREHFGSDRWNVYRYDGTQWNIIRKPKSMIDNSLFNDIVAYDEHDEIIEYLQPYDPIQGYIPGALFHIVDIISDTDPVNYNVSEYTKGRYTQMVGSLWLDTRDLIYVDYHQGDDTYKKDFWGSLFPYADASVYEWTKSKELPVEFDGEVLSNDLYIKKNEYDKNTGIYVEYYYFWAKNPVDIPENVTRIVSANDVSQSIKYPNNNGIPMISLIDNYLFAIHDSSKRLIMSDIVLRLNYNYKHTNVQTHTQWKLIDESEENDDIPESIFDKMIESIVGYDDALNPVPDTTIPPVNRYGTNKGQTWFFDVTEARKVFFTKLNTFLKTINIWDIDFLWEDLYDGVQAPSIVAEYTDWFHEDYNEDIVIHNIVGSRNDLKLTLLRDGEYVKVIEQPSIKPTMRNGGWTVYQYLEDVDSYKKLAQSNGTIRFRVDHIVNNGIAPQDIENLGKILKVIFNHFAISPYNYIINDILFTMVRMVFSEQPNNNWLFPTTYIIARQELDSMIKKLIYQKSKEEEIRDYIREAKPYHTKLREIKTINHLPDENIDMHVTDFDKPLYINDIKETFVLQERQIDRVIPDYDAGKQVFTLENFHATDVRVVIDDVVIPRSDYDIDDNIITFNFVPKETKNLVPSIIIQSDNVVDRTIIANWNETRGYEILDNTRDLGIWADLAINKHILINYDRVTYHTNQLPERVLELYQNAFDDYTKPYTHLESLSNDIVDSDEELTEMDRVLMFMYNDELESLVKDSTIITITGTEHYIHEIDKVYDDPVITFNGKLVDSRNYDITYPNGKTLIKFYFEPLVNDVIAVRDRNQYLTLLHKMDFHLGLNVIPDSTIYVPENSDYWLVDVNGTSPSFVDNTVVDIDGLHILSHGSDDGITITGGDFINNDDHPEELSRLNIHETMVFMSLNQQPPLVKLTYDRIGSQGIQPTSAYTIEDGVTEYAFTQEVPNFQVKVIVENDILAEFVDYTIENGNIVLQRDFPAGKSLVVTDLYTNFDPNYHNQVGRIKNITDGFDSFIFDHSKTNDMPTTREFIVYNKVGNSYFLKNNNENYFTMSNKPDRDTTMVDINETLNNDIHNRLFVILGFDLDPADNEINVDFEFIKGSIINNTLTRMTRGLFVDEHYDFTDKDTVRLYELHVQDDLEYYVIQEQLIGATGRHSYPKYGNIFN